MKHALAIVVVVAIVAVAATAAWWFLRGPAPAATANGEISESAAGRAQQKLDAIVAHGAAPPGSRPPLTTALSEDEINSHFQYRMGAKIPKGVYQVRFSIHAGRVMGNAVVDFDEVKAGQRKPINPLLDYMLTGKRPVSGAGAFTSSNGSGVFHLEQVSIGSISLSGTTLDLLMRHVVLPRYPKAAIDRPFELPNRIDRLVLEEGRVVIYQR